jgi:hypothetical protein
MIDARRKTPGFYKILASLQAEADVRLRSGY